MFSQPTTIINPVLDKGSKWLGLDLHYFIKGSFWLTGIQIISIISGFILSLLYARFLPKLTFGQYTYILSFISFFGSFAHPGMQTAVIRAVAQGRERILQVATKITLKWAALAALPLLGLSGYYFVKPASDLTLGLAFLICFLFAIPYWSFRFYDSYFIGKQKFNSLFSLTLLSGLISLAAISITLLFTNNILILIIAGFGSSSFSNIFFTIFTFSQTKPKSPIRSDLAFARNLNDVQIFIQLASFADKIIIAKLLGFEAVAIYTFAQLVPEQLKSFLKNFYTLSLPKLSKLSLTEKKVFLQKFGQLTLFTGFLILLSIIFISPIFKLFFPTYTESVRYAQILSLSILATPALVIKAMFEANAMISLLRWQTYPAYGLQILLLIFLTMKFHLIGAVWGIVISRSVFILTSLVLLRFFKFKNA